MFCVFITVACEAHITLKIKEVIKTQSCSANVILVAAFARVSITVACEAHITLKIKAVIKTQSCSANVILVAAFAHLAWDSRDEVVADVPAGLHLVVVGPEVAHRGSVEVGPC